jgi:TatD DNase family protein
MSPSPLVDSHVHLDRYTDAQCAAMLDRAAAAGVRALLTAGMDEASSRRAIALAQRFGTSHGVVAAVGWHPAALPARAAAPEALATTIAASLAQLLAAAPAQVVAIGEIGLDTVEGRAPLAIQAGVFRAQLRLAHDRGLPIVLHIRGADAIEPAQRMLATAGIGAGMVVHYFTGGLVEAQRWLALGCHISVGRPVTRATEAALRAAIASPDVPLARLLLETDTYPLPGRRTEPAAVAGVAAALAALKHLPASEVARRTTINFRDLFLRTS